MYIYVFNIFEGNLEIKFPTIWRDEKQSRGGREKKKIRREKLEEKD